MESSFRASANNTLVDGLKAEPIQFICLYCPLRFQQLTELVEHYEDRHTLPALAAYTPAKFQKEA